MSRQAIAPARLEGMQLAIEFADFVETDWSDRAFEYLVNFARTHEVFTGEDVSDAHIAANKPQPPDLRAWGALYRRAMNEGVISRYDTNGWSKRRSSPTIRYRSNYYRRQAA